MEKEMGQDDGETVILANGSFPRRKNRLEKLRNAKRVVCCDGAALPLLRFGRVPDLTVGDLDSLPESCRKQLGNRVVCISEQETNDLQKAFRVCMSRGWTSLVIFGAGGRREDHFLGNISLLPLFAQAGADVRMETDYGTFFPVLESGEFFIPPPRKVSIFSFHPDMPISSEGLVYPLEHLCLPYWWCGTLNKAKESTFSLTFDGRMPLVLYYPNR